MIFGGSEDACPSTISGPFRIKLKGLHDHRDRSLIAGPWLSIDAMNQRIPILRTAREREARFYFDLGMMVEPRMWFTQEGPARAIEAVDELGQSLVRRETTRVEADHSLFHNGGGVTQGQVQLDLAMPENRAGRSSGCGVDPGRDPGPEARAGPGDPPAGRQGPDDRPRGRRTSRSGAPEDDQGTQINIDIRINLDRFELPAGRDGEIVSSRLGA